MLYYVTVVDMSGETGISKWDYVHPETPRALFEHLKAVRDYIPPMTYGIVSVVSRDLFGDRLRRMEFAEMQIVIGKLRHGEKAYYVFFLADIRDHPRAVWKIFMDFYEEQRDLFDKILTSEIVEVADTERLRNSFSAYLVDKYRKSPLLGARDRKSLLVGFLITLAVMSCLVMITWWINHIYHLIDKQSTWLTYTYVIIVMHFIAPGPIIGYITQYRKHAEAICVANGLIWALIVSSIWYETLQIGIWNSFHIRMSPSIFYMFVIISGLIYGAVLMMSTIPFAEFFERHTLTSPRHIPISKEQPMIPEPEAEQQSAQDVEAPSEAAQGA